MLYYYKLLTCYIIYPSISYGYGSIPINTIFSGMNIHLPAILMFTRGTRTETKAIKARREDFSAPLDEILAPGDPPAGAKKWRKIWKTSGES